MSSSNRSRRSREGQHRAGSDDAEVSSVAGRGDRNAPELDGQAAINAAMFATLESLAQRLDRHFPPGGGPVPDPMPVPEAPEGVAPAPVVDAVQPPRRVSMREFLGMSPPVFRGEPDEDVLYYLAEMKKIGKHLKCSEAETISFATYNLKDEANEWWLAVERDGMLTDVLWTWERFEAAMVARFVSPGERYAHTIEFYGLTQGSKTVREYVNEFNRLSKYIRRSELSEQLRIQRFVQGLNSFLGPLVGMQLAELTSFSQAVERARFAELMRSRPSDGQSFKKRKSDDRPSGSGFATGAPTGSHVSQASVSDQQSRGRAGYGSGWVPVCHQCGVAGHIRRNCPQNRVESHESRARVRSPSPTGRPVGQGRDVVPQARGGGDGRGQPRARGNARLYGMVAREQPTLDAGILSHTQFLCDL